MLGCDSSTFCTEYSSRSDYRYSYLGTVLSYRTCGRGAAFQFHHGRPATPTRARNCEHESYLDKELSSEREPGRSPSLPVFKAVWR